VSDAPSSAPYGWNETRPPRWLPRGLVYVIVAALLFIGARTIVSSLSNFLVIILVSLFLSFAIEPAVDFLADRGWRRGAATALVFFIVFVLGGLLVWLMVDLVVQQVRTLVDEAPRLINKAAHWINHRFHTKITTNKIVQKVKSFQGDVAKTAGDVGGRVLSVTSSVVGFIFRGFTVALFTFYLVADGPRMRRTVLSVLPPERQRLVLRLYDIAVRKTGGYLYSRMLLALMSAFFAWIAFSIIGIPSPLALALFMGVVSQFVPVVGTYIGGALPVLIALIGDPVKAIWVLGYLIVYGQIENYFFAPRISARTMEIHPAVAFGSVIIGGSLLGGIGAILALPAAAIVQAFVSSYIHRYELVEADESFSRPSDESSEEETPAGSDSG
jgi:predicted PurR-regulated permease PerM